jgi:hypothetical protein
MISSSTLLLLTFRPFATYRAIAEEPRVKALHTKVVKALKFMLYSQVGGEGRAELGDN